MSMRVQWIADIDTTDEEASRLPAADVQAG